MAEGTVSVINGTKVTTTIPVGQHPYPPVMAPDGTLYVANSGDGTVSVLR